MTGDLVCVDLSHWQDTVDFEQLCMSGVAGVILKATEGTGYTDPTYRKRYDQAVAAGMTANSYHFFKAGNPIAQMDHYIAVVEPVIGERMVIDYEDPACTLYELKEAAQYLESLGFQVTIYGANGFLGAQLAGKADPVLANYDLWVASYTTASEPTMTDLKGTWPEWALWQYTDKAIVEGVVGNVDGNRFNGTPEQFWEWMLPVAETPSRPVPGPEIVEAPYVTIALSSDVPVNISISVGANVTLVGAVPAT
jgi:lysozyme